MKTIINKEVKIKVQDKLMLRSDLLSIVTNNPPERGLTISAMRERIKILDIIEKADKEDIMMEDAEFNTLKKLYDDYGWTAPHKDIIELADHLDELSKQK